MEPEAWKRLLPEVILASGSVARRWLLERQGVVVHQAPTGIDERSGQAVPERHVEDLAVQKLTAYLAGHPDPPCPVLACDTMIWFEGRLIGKPADEAEARAMLRSFSGKPQMVTTGYALFLRGRTFHGSDDATVWFRRLSDEDIASYLATGEWRGAAGAYRIQWQGKKLVERTEGSLSTILGLPSERIYAILEANRAS